MDGVGLIVNAELPPYRYEINNLNKRKMSGEKILGLKIKTI